MLSISKKGEKQRSFRINHLVKSSPITFFSAVEQKCFAIFRKKMFFAGSVAVKILSTKYNSSSVVNLSSRKHTVNCLFFYSNFQFIM